MAYWLSNWQGLDGNEDLLVDNWLWNHDLGNELDDVCHSSRVGYRLSRCKD